MVSVTDKTRYRKLAPGDQNLTNATDVTSADVAEGDRIWARALWPRTVSRYLLTGHHHDQGRPCEEAGS